MDNKKIPTWLGVTIIIIFTFTAGVFLWEWEKKEGDIQMQDQITTRIKNDNKQAYQKINTDDINSGKNFNQAGLIYKNDQYGFMMNLPEEMKNNYKTYANPVKNEVGQQDKCVDCYAIQFVVSTQDRSYADFMKSGEKILFVIWVRDVDSWNKNHNNSSYVCIGESTIVAKTKNYIYNLCPFDISDSEKKHYPVDSQVLLEKALPIIKSSFTVN